MIFYCEKLDEILVTHGHGLDVFWDCQNPASRRTLTEYLDDNDWVFVGYL